MAVKTENLLSSQVGAVVIGRNEGERLKQCLLSVLKSLSHVVYVDSGSTDNSVAIANSLSVAVVNLDLSTSFTAARARNAGLTHLLALYHKIEYVQFVDGDCEVQKGWLETAYKELQANPTIAVVCGRRRERFPKKSVYNQLCDLEWDTPVGEAKACGGDSMMRIKAFQEVGGFNAALIAGEEPELCVRLRQKKWKIVRLQAEMTLHDANIFRFSQWWKRNVRAGHAYAEGGWLQGSSPERHWVKESRSILFWGGILPFLVIAGVLLTRGWSLLFLGGYIVLMYRIYDRQIRQSQRSHKDAFPYAFFCVLGKLPQMNGYFQFHWNRWLGRSLNLIEYKIEA